VGKYGAIVGLSASGNFLSLAARHSETNKVWATDKLKTTVFTVPK
jgi:hypothetical protein